MDFHIAPKCSRFGNIKVRSAWQISKAVQGGEIVKKFLKRLTAATVTFGLLCAGGIGAADYLTPDSYTVAKGGNLSWSDGMLSVVKDGSAEVTANAGNLPQTYSAKLMLYKTIPLKPVRVNVVDNSCVVLCGMPFGIKMFTNGVVVVGLADIKTPSGTVNPASEAGLRTGDVILSVNGQKTAANTDVEKAVETAGNHPIKLVINRDGQKMPIIISPVQSEADGLYKVGLWVRDSTAGIGTLTFYDPARKTFAGLGHGICDSDTGRLMPLLSGDIVPVTISGVTKGVQGTPGELRGYFSDSHAIGSLSANVDEGVYGIMNRSVQGKAVKIAMKQDVKTGPAQVYTTIGGTAPHLYDVQIERIDYRDSAQGKNLVLHITDPQLLAQTGGIVQGMSGSPILQDGKLAGAVTHVFVNDPTRGYGIFAESMMAESRSVADQEKAASSH